MEKTGHTGLPPVPSVPGEAARSLSAQAAATAEGVATARPTRKAHAHCHRHHPGKQGKYLAATHLRIESPNDVLPRLSEGTTIYAMKSNYLDETLKQAGPTFQNIGIDHE
ncbi:hypothetical protein [Paraburkholderia silvatlantica]|uniref:hypothetical protein n=1 Tax=Paraburkholderia silvatlantica TaxID=321895 RepID=UPI0037513E81